MAGAHRVAEGAVPRDERLVAPKGCVWPASYTTCCGDAPAYGRLCAAHLRQVRACKDTWACAWPGCRSLSAATRGLCTFHAAITGWEGEPSTSIADRACRQAGGNAPEQERPMRPR